MDIELAVIFNEAIKNKWICHSDIKCNKCCDCNYNWYDQ